MSGSDRPVLDELAAVLRDRREHPPEDSYSAVLLRDPATATRKVMEESYELCYELTRPVVDRERVTSEAADLLFHVLAGLVGADVEVDAVLDELAARRRGSR